MLRSGFRTVRSRAADFARATSGQISERRPDLHPDVLRRARVVNMWTDAVVTTKGGPAMPRKCLPRLAVILLVIVPALILSAGPGRADDHNKGPVKLLKTV